MLAATSDDANRIIFQVWPRVIFLDYDLAPGISSEPVAEYLAMTSYRGAVYIHSHNPFGQQVLQRIFATAVIAPFGEFEIQRHA